MMVLQTEWNLPPFSAMHAVYIDRSCGTCKSLQEIQKLLKCKNVLGCF